MAAANPQAIVSVELQGGIGNQIFQYAAGHALARRTGAALRLYLGRFTHIGKVRSDELACFALPAPICDERRRRCLRPAGNPENEGAALRRRTRLMTRDRGQSGLVGTNE